MLTHNLGFPRIGRQRELKKASEKYWAGKTMSAIYFRSDRRLGNENWLLQKEARY